MTQGIYLIKNNVNGKAYIGQSKNIERRWIDHKSTANSNSNERRNYPLYRAMNKYGVDNFSFSILEEVEDYDQLNSIENKYIAEFNSIAKGYNQMITSMHGLSKEELIAKRELKYPVTKDKLRSELFQYSFEKVGSIYGVSSNTIRKWCKDYGIPSSAKDYVSESKSLAYSNKMKDIAREASTVTKRVAMLDKTTNTVLREFNSLNEASKYVGTTPNNIARAIHGYEGRNTSLGYRWAFIK